MKQQTRAIAVFFCYAREDEDLLNGLRKHLRLLQRQNVINLWYDGHIRAGEKWEEEIKKHLNEADIILMLISPDFINSDYCYNTEMKHALERHGRQEAIVIPIIACPVAWQETTVGNSTLGLLQALPKNAKPVTTWENRDEAWKDVTEGIERVANNLLSLKKPSIYKTIDTDEVVTLFQHLMQPNSHTRVLRLVGETKMGKSHLLAKVFPSLVEQDDGTRYAFLDMRNRMYAVPDILDMACSSLGWENFDLYLTAYREWNSRLRRETRRSQSNQGTKQSISDRDRDLTLQFVRDLSRLDDKLLLFLFDSVSNANKYMQAWVSNIFLPHVSQTAHVRTVVAGRSLPNVHGSYALCCEDYRLQAITNVDDYINYCRGLGALLGEQSIRDFAYACDYVPGMFVELVDPKFIKGKNRQ